MQRDSQVRACLTTKRLSVLSEKLEVHPADDSPASARAAAIVDAQLASLVGGAAGVVIGALDALAMGFAIGELLWNPDGTLSQVYWHDPRRFIFHGDAFGDVEDVEVLDAALRWPRSNFVVYSYQPKYGDPYGESDLLAAYRPWNEKDLLRRMWLTALDKFGSPTPVGSVPSSWNQGQVDDLTNKLSNLGPASALVITNDVVVDAVLDPRRIEPGAGYASSITYQDGQIARAILGQEMTTSGNSGAGGSSSQALATVHLDVQTDWIQALRADVAENVLTQQVARSIVTMMMGPDAAASVCPVVRFPNLSPSELAVRQLVISAMVTGGVVAPTESWIRAYLGLPEASANA